MPPDTRLAHRREILIGGLAVSAGLATGPVWAKEVLGRFEMIEARAGGRLGVYAKELGGQMTLSYRADERFLMCSTFKSLAVAALLSRVDKGHEHLDRWIAYGKADLLDYAPVSKANLAKGGMPLGDLCAAAVELSDNTAANLILTALGGPGGVTAYARALGDQVTRLDRNEPALNDPGAPGDPHDTTTPGSMAGLWFKILLGDALSPVSRGRLTGWLEACQTGAARLKSVTPAGWTIGHKTGTGPTTIGDIALITAPTGRKLIVAVYFEAPAAVSHPHDEVIAEAGRIALRLIAPNPLRPAP